MNVTILKRLSVWKPRKVNPAIRERLFERKQRTEGPWVSSGLLRALTPVMASFALVLAVMQEVPAVSQPHLQEMDVTSLASTNAASFGLLSQVPQPTLEWNRLALATLASTNLLRSFSSNGSFWALSTNIFVR